MEALEAFILGMPINIAMVFINIAMVFILICCLVAVISIFKLENKDYLDFLHFTIVAHGLFFTSLALILRNFVYQGKSSEVVTYGAVAWIAHIVIVILFSTYLKRVQGGSLLFHKYLKRADDLIDKILNKLEEKGWTM